MKVRYTKRALAQIDEVLTYIEARSFVTPPGVHPELADRG